MHLTQFATIRQTFSGQVAKDDVAAIIRHHRIQASPGYRDAANYVLAELQHAGLEATIETYPATYETRFWEAQSFQEWDAKHATLHLIEPADQARKLADYREMKLSLIQRSIPFDGEAEVVLLEDGLSHAEYEDVDVAGKIVLSKGPVERIQQLAVEQYGALGILFDGMRETLPVRESIDLPDARQYTSFWWSGRPEEQQCFGFVLSPRQGNWLRKLIRSRKNAGLLPVKLKAKVDASFYDGAIELVSAVIPARHKTHESVIIVSHLCHPQPSANDNATGVAANLEAARTLQHLIDSSHLPAPQRNIRFLWMPEMTGSYAYLSRHGDETMNFVAGLNLDMVGEDQSQTGSVLLLERPPDAASSFAPELLERLREELYDDSRTLTGIGGYALYRYATTAFSGGSDHYIFSDPTVGIPMPMLIQWPDKFYHTSADTLDKVNPGSLDRAGSLAAAYAYFIATAGKPETTWLAHEMLSRFQVRLARTAQSHVTRAWQDPAEESAPNLARQIDYLLDRFRASLRTLTRLSAKIDPELDAVVREATEFAQRQKERAIQFGSSGAQGEPGVEPQRNEWEQQAANLIPKRLYRGPGIGIGTLSGLSLEERTAVQELLQSRSEGGHTLPVLAEYWADGQRSILQIIDLIEMETGIRDPELIVSHFELLKKLTLVIYV